MYDDLASIEEGLAGLTATLDPALVHGPDALVALERSCRIIKLATAAAMLLGKRVHETDAWKASGRPSAAHLLANLAGISLSEAMTLLGTAKKMGRLPKTDDAARRGKLSGKQASEVSKGAAADPEAEDELLGLAANGSTSELTEESRRRRFAAAGDDQQRHARINANRALFRFAGDDGSAGLRWRHLPEVGAELDAILSDYIDDEFAEARRQGRREQRCAYAADALVVALRDAAAFRRGETIDDDVDEPVDVESSDEVVDSRPVDSQPDDADVEAATEDDDDADTVDRRPPEPFDEESTPSGPTSEPTRSNRRSRRRDGERPPGRSRRRTRRRGADAKVIVRIDYAALIRGSTEPGEICDIAGIGPVPVTSVAALMDDAFLAAVVTRGRDVLTVTHLGRRPNAFQETAMQAGGVRCAVLGCPNTHLLQRDHEEDWARTHHTRLDELDWLCPHDHDLKTTEGYRLVPGTGPREFLSPEQQRARAARQAAPTQTPTRSQPPRSRPAGQRPGRRPSPPAEALTLDL